MIAKRRYPVAARRARGLAVILASVSDRTLSIALGTVAALVFLLLTIGHPTVYDYFGRLAEALWRGEWWLDDAPAHLNELVQGVGGHRYALAPPMPALLLLPLVPLLGSAVAQTSLSAVLGGLSALPIFRAQRALGVPRALALWTTILSTFGTTLLVTAVDGRSWFAADAMAFFFATLALWSAAARAPAWLTGAALGAAILSRGPLALAIPGLLLLRLAGTARAGILPALIGFSAGLAPFAVAYLAYDLARWGTLLDVGYATFAQTDPFYTRGLFSLSYLPRQVYAMFFESPAFVDEHLFFLRARSVGMSLLITTPAYLWLARAVLARRVFGASVPLWLCCLTLLPDLLFGTIGFEQYGYRRSLDAQAFLMPLVAVGAGMLAREWLPAGTGLFRAAVILSVLITFYFFTTIRTFGFA